MINHPHNNPTEAVRQTKRPSAWNKLLLKKLKGIKSNSPHFMELKISLTHSQELDIGPKPVPQRIHFTSSVHTGLTCINPYPTAFPYGNGMVLHFYKQQESSTTKTVHKVEGRQHRRCIIPQAVTHSLVLLKMGKIIARNMLS